MTFGVTAQGFKPKPFSAILADLEEANARPDAFGSLLVQTPQSPMGVWNGLRADLAAELYELAAEIYAANDPDQAEGINLDRIARVRLLRREIDETDADFAQAITNAGQARIAEADFLRAVLAVPNVTWARIYENATDTTDTNGLPPHSVSVAALGGTDEAIALVARQHVAAGITRFGNRTVEVEVDGYCTTMALSRPAQVPVFLELTVTKGNDDNGCPPPSNAAIAATVVQAFTGQGRPRNGVTLTDHMVRNALCDHPSVEVTGVRFKFGNLDYASLPYTFGFNSIPSFSEDRTTVLAP